MVRAWPGLHAQPLTSFVLAPQHHLMVTTASLSCSATAWRVHPDTGQASRLREFALSGGVVTSLAASPCGGMLLTSCLDGTLALWSLQTLDLLHSVRLKHPPRCAALHPGGVISVAVGTEVRDGGRG